MFRITEDPSSGSLIQCLAKSYKNDCIVSVDMDKVGVMAAYCDPLCVCVVHCVGRHCLSELRKAVSSCTVNYTHTHDGSKYAAITPTLSMSTDTIQSFL